MPRTREKKIFPGKRQQQRMFREARNKMRQHLPQFPLGETTRNLLVSRQTQNGVSQSHDGDDDQKMDRISTDKCNAASTTATCPEGSETESMCDSADSYDILSPNGSDDDGVPVSDSDEESYQDCLDEDVNDADDSQRYEIKSELAKWAIECGIPRTHISRLLCILRKCKGLSHLPKDYRTLLKTASQGSTKDVQPGYYFHFGLSNGGL
ncbi:uncharacterized protein LOC116935358 [Daphnia magna]|uniref:uncharacterized protein LOC116935358 n=1 Tax=Daphnia magna TaxID=35525 RepID=UPI001E1BD486|nr:uncharacterized protein LOC116935358 [Daphnia magna]